MSPVDPVGRHAGLDDTGRTCPYCRFACKSGVQVVDCPTCSALHHADCWADNGGCAVVGCAAAPAPDGAPGRAGIAKATADVGAAPERSTASRPPPPPGRPPSPGPRRSRALTGAIVALVVVVLGAGAAVTLSLTKSHDAPTTAAATQRPETVTVARTVTTASPAALPAKTKDATAGTRTAQITRTLARYYDAIVRGAYDDAWKLLSPSYRAWKADNGGYAKWREQEANNERYLDPSGLRVEVTELDRDSQIATLDVRGMRWNRPGAPSCPYEGVTWARRVDGRWTYDQGYAQRPERAARWRSRANETLGVPCEDDNY